MTAPDPDVLRARELAASIPTLDAAGLVELARLGLGDLATSEREGGDLVGTDAYPVLRDAWPALADRVEHGTTDVRIAAAYALAFVLEPADETLPRIDRAAEAASDPIARAGLRLASARLGASIALLRGRAPEVPFDGITLDERAQGLPPLERAIVALGQVFALPSFPRKVLPDLAEALDGVAADTALGPWGGGSIPALIAALRKTLWVQAKPDAPAPAPAPTKDIGDDDVADPYSQQRPERGAPRVVLDGLRDVDWAKLEHAYGDAGGVPGMLDGLSSANPADRAWAIDALDASIHHQGSVYSASTAATPFLIRLAGEPGLEGRAEILELLCGIAVHQPAQCLVQGARKWRSEAYDAVVAGGPTYARLLADAEPQVRTAAAYVLAYVDPPPPGALDALRAALSSERDRRARASELLALGYVSKYLGSVEDRARLEAFVADDAPLIRGAAALALMQLAGAAAPVAAREVLTKLPAETAPIRGFFPWAEGDLAGFARTLRLAFQSDDELWAAIDAVLAGGGDQDIARRAAARLFRGLFYDDVHGAERPWLPAELDAPRRKLLRFYCAITPVPEHGRPLLPFWEVAWDAGLFSSRDHIERLLGDNPGALDRELAIGGETRPLWAWIITGAPELVATAGAWPTKDRLAAVDDALALAYAVTSPRWHTEYGAGDDHPHSPDRANNLTSSRLVLLADLAGTDDEAVAWARARASAQAAKADKRDSQTGLVAALVLARDAAARGTEVDAAIDALCNLDQSPAMTYRDAMRAVLKQLPPARAERLVLAEPLYAYQAYVDPRGEVRRWTNRGGWQMIDCAPPAVIVREVLAAIREHQRHLGAGDDRGAVPVLGTTTSSIESKPRAAEPFPRDRAIALLTAALATGEVTDTEQLTAAQDFLLRSP